jgi:Spy/CpxP family protein refolding chaperone
MRLNNVSKVIVILAIMGIVGYAATSFAGRGRGWGGGGYCDGPGSGWAERGYGGQGYQGNLSDEEIAKLDNERQTFLKETSDLRDGMYQKKLELRSEMAKKDPDAEKAVAIQKEISDLRSQLDQKRIEHRIKMKKENPEFFAGRGPGRGYGYGPRGKGMGYDPGSMGRGFGGPRGGGMGYGPGRMDRGFGGRGGSCW